MRVTKLFCLLAFGFLLNSFQAHAETMAKKLKPFLQELSSFEADFQQIVTDENGYSLQSLNGKIALLKPNLFRWETNDPLNQLLISDGQKIWLFDRDLEQVTVRSSQQQFENTPIQVLSGNVDSFLDQYSVEGQQKNSQTWKFTLTPNVEMNFFETLELLFVDKMLTQMTMTDDLGQTTRLFFTKISQNSQIDSDYFQFIPPDGVDVIQDSASTP